MGNRFFFLYIAIAFSAALTLSVSWAQSSHPLHAGIYSAEQASRGETAYMATCASCHANDLRGNSNSPGLIGVGFLFLWEERPLAELFQKMRDEMPTDRPGSLPAETYVDLLAFLLHSNGYPSGSNALTTAVLADETLSIIAPP